MADLVFATKGQAEALAAQEQIAKKSRELKAEFESGAKTTQAWDTNMAKLARTSESALRSVQTEQEKITRQIDDIQEAVKNGLYDGREQEAEEALTRLRKKWVDVDDATLQAKKQAVEFERAQQRLEGAAKTALESVKTELEEVEQQIADVQAASEAGLIDTDEAQEAIKRLQGKIQDLSNDTREFGDKSLDALKKAFDPVQILKVGVSFIGIKQALDYVQKEIDDRLAAIDRRMKAQEEAGEAAEKRIIGYGAAVGMAPVGGLPLGMPTPQDFGSVQNKNQTVGFGEAQKKGYQSMAEVGRGDYLTADQRADMDNIMAELGIGPVARYLSTLGSRMPWSDGGSGITRDEAIGIYEKAARVSSDLITPTGRESVSDLIQILERYNNADAQFKAEQLRRLDTMIDELRNNGVQVGGY